MELFGSVNGRKEYTFFWFIENYSYLYCEKTLIGSALNSPDFTVDGLEATVWKIKLYPKGYSDDDKGNVSLSLKRITEDDGPENISITCELSFFAESGWPLSSVKFDYAFRRGLEYGIGDFLELDEIFFQSNVIYLPRDVLTVRCKIWRGEGSVHTIGQSSARTVVVVRKVSFLHVVERFSLLQPNVKQEINILPLSNITHPIYCSLHFTKCSFSEEKIMIEIIPDNYDQILCKCELSLLDASGNEIECGKADYRYDIEGKSINRFPLSLTRQAILNRKTEYLPDDKLSLLCKCNFFYGIDYHIEETQHGISTAALKRTSNRVSGKNSNKTIETSSEYPSAMDDLKYLYISQFLTDVELETKSNSWRAHKIVLCARSPVFKAMMTSNMKEKNSHSIQIDDLGDDVVQQLLLFLYKDTIENLHWEIAIQLYYAADKYQVNKLKEFCSSFLVANLDPTNAGELLLLADTHNDTNLKKLVEGFILEYEEQVFTSEEWKILVETHPLLAVRAMGRKYQKRNLKEMS